MKLKFKKTSLNPLTQESTQPPKRHTILLVDDEEFNLVSLRELLSKDYHILTAHDGKDALETIQALDNPHDLHLIIADQRMPRMEGVLFLTKAFEIVPKAVRILLTGFADIEKIISSVNQAHVYQIIMKPINSDEFLLMVRRSLEKYELDRVIPENNSDLLEKQKALYDDEIEQQRLNLIQTQSQLIQAEKMADLGNLISGVAHEINNPTNFLNLSVKSLENDFIKHKSFLIELLEEEPDILEMLQEQFHRIEDAIHDIHSGNERIMTHVRDLGMFSRKDKEEQTVVNIIENLKTTIRLTQTEYKKEVQIVSHIPEKYLLKCWPSKLNQVFMNLIVNACQAIVQKKEETENSALGTLTIRAFEQSHPAVKNALAIQFSDTGVGMNEATQKKIFEPFFTTKPAGKGTGLGMLITHDIIKEHLGAIDIESTLGEGATITLYLPMKIE